MKLLVESIDRRKFEGGLTLVELLIVIAIGLVLLASIGPITGALQQSAQLTVETDALSQAFHLARTRTVARSQNGAWGVHITNSASGYTYVLFLGDTYATRNTDYDEEYILPSGITLSTTAVGGTTIFTRGSGTTTPATITLTHSVKGEKTISLFETGTVNVGS